ncbi:MAG: ABC transporter ATP-binding protein [Isosphaera sp.]|nr:ABC transporter ATP-binding protein [Isosphaera sp.]
MPTIQVENLSKLYLLGEHGRGTPERRPVWAAVTGAVTGPARRLFGRLAPGRNGRPAAPKPDNHLWALKDVSFAIEPGEMVGFIGRNGSGKSTLLKILTGIVEPTEGRATIRGRVGSLLEVGTGFHPELTGRENVFLNGSILGMGRKEIARKFDEIVAFSEVEAFIDTPVKRYSSGMYVRLAFAVAAHLDPHILIIDEVLAVGDGAFQRKCLEAMERIAGTGCTVLFVSHAMESVRHLCRRAIYLRSGRLVGDGPTAEVIHSYLTGSTAVTDQDPDTTPVGEWWDRQGNGQARVVGLDIADAAGRPVRRLPIGSTLRLTLHAEFSRPVVDPCFGVLIHNDEGQTILDLRSFHGGLASGRVEGRVSVEATVDRLGLYPGHYRFSPWICTGDMTEVLDWVVLCRNLEMLGFAGPDADRQIDPSDGVYWAPSAWRVC